MMMQILPTLFLGSLILGTSEISWNRVEDSRRCRPLRTQRILPRPLFFAEIQNYRLVENYLHYWIDRPLYHDSSLRGKNSYMESMRRNIAIAREYGLDGFTILGNAPSLRNDWRLLLSVLAEEKGIGFAGMAGAVYSRVPDAQWYENFLDSYRIAASSPHSLRIGGKIVVWAYHAQFFPVELFSRLRTLIEKENLPEPFLFTIVNDLEMQKKFQEKGFLSKDEEAQFRALLEEQLCNADGIMVYPAGKKRPEHGEYAARPVQDPFYRRYTLPFLLELLAEERFSSKAVGAYVYKGYVNHLSGNIAGEYGSSAFRLAMEELVLLNPDIITFFEWNEANENTHYQPTVANGNAMKRIVRNYMSLLRGEPSLPEKNDNTAIPNLIVSSRMVLRLGENIEYEFLNLPDTEKTSLYSVELRLKDVSGAVLKRFPAEHFNRAEFKSVTISVPSLQFSVESILIPEIAITGPDGKMCHYELRHMRIDPSVCSNYKEIMQPVREQLACDFQYFWTGDTLKAEVNSKIPLRSFELLLNEDEVAAAGDVQANGDLSRAVTIRGHFAAFEPVMKQISFEISGSPEWYFCRDHYRNAPDQLRQFENRKVLINYRIPFYYPEYFFIRYLPAKNAILKIAVDGFLPLEFKCSDLEKKGKFAQAFPGAIRLDLEIVRNLADIPTPLNRRKAQLQYRLAHGISDYPQAAELRAVSMDGKIRRMFIDIMNPSCKSTLKLPVLDVNAKRAVNVDIPQRMQRDIVYRFSPEHGALLYAPRYPEFTGELGGGFQYLEPFNRPRPELLKHLGGASAAPQWFYEDKRWGLHFDGNANYVNFPREALPYGAFTLQFEIRPSEAGRSEVLFRNFSHHDGSLNLFRHNDKLMMIFTRRTAQNKSELIRITTSLELPAGSWSNVSVAMDLENITFNVNGKSEEKAFPYQGYFFKPSVFGGHVYPAFAMPSSNTKFFKGDLRFIRILHGIENKKQISKKETLK